MYDTPAGDGTYLVTQPVVQHNGLLGTGFKIMNKTYGPAVSKPTEYVENAPKDMVTALPSQITRIKATFDKPGRYVWHCHILSHEDHEMMRVLYVGGGAVPKHIVADASHAVPNKFALEQNYPNPFNAGTEIRYQIPADAHVTLKIFNTLGQEVRTLADNQQVAGEYRIRWDGRNDYGYEVSSGVYFYAMQAGEFTQTRKMVLLK
jgi:hypothetical protein